MGDQNEGTAAADVDAELGLELLRRMLRVRKFELRVQALAATGELPGPAHLYTGQEAVAAGACAVLRDDDYVSSTHRGHGHVVAKGASIAGCMAELFGKATGVCHGKGGSMHMADMSLGIIGANGIVAAGIPIAVGRGALGEHARDRPGCGRVLRGWSDQ